VVHRSPAFNGFPWHVNCSFGPLSWLHRSFTEYRGRPRIASRSYFVLTGVVSTHSPAPDQASLLSRTHLCTAMETPRKPQKTTKLTGDRAARKREQDRQAQRSAREKTKKLIAHLESRIETLTRFHNSGNVQELIDELETQRKANEALRNTLRSIEKAINTGLSEASTSPLLWTWTALTFLYLDTVLQNYNTAKKELDDDSSSTDRQNGKHLDSNGSVQDVAQHSSLVGPIQHHLPQQSASPPFDEPTAMLDKFSSNGAFMNIPDALLAKTSDVQTPFNSTLHSFPLDIPVPIQSVVHSTEAPCDCCKQLLYMNEMLGRFALSCARTMADQGIRDADIAIRAVLHGWDAVTHLYPLDPIWNMLRAADEGLWRTCGTLERLSTIRVVSLMLRVRTASVCFYPWLTLSQYLSDPSEPNLSQLPRFMRQRPSQTRIIHKPLIDFLVWYVSQ
jgi:hypothetical protein